MYNRFYVEFMRRLVEIILGMTFVELLTFVLVLIALSRCSRLRKRLDALTDSARGLIDEQEARYTRELLGRAKDKGPG